MFRVLQITRNLFRFRARSEGQTGNVFLELVLPAVLLSGIKLWLVAAQTIWAIPGTHDDLLFTRLAHSIGNGNWLGDFNSLTLIKGPFYPLWIALTHRLHVPLLLAQHILYAIGCLLIAVAIKPVLISRRVPLIAFAFLLFNPMSFANGPMTRVVREGIYPALTILVIAGALGLFLRYHRPARVLLPWAGLLCLALPCFWLTREEGVWLVPLLGILLVATLLKLRDGTRTRVLKAIVLLLPLGSCWLASEGIRHKNSANYEAPFVIEINTSAFKDAYGALTRIKHQRWHPMIPVPTEARKQVYDVSPAFRELEPYLEDDGDDSWSRIFTIEGQTGEIIGGWFLWAFRDAVNKAGYYSSWPRARDYYEKLATEINTSCDDGKLSCNPRRSTLLAPWRMEYLSPFLNAVFRSLIYLARLDGFSARSDKGIYEGPNFDLFKKMTLEDLGEHEDRRSIAGWAFSPNHPIDLSLRKRDGTVVNATLGKTPRPDVHDHFLKNTGADYKTSRESGFFITTNDLEGVYLTATAEGRILGQLLLDGSNNSLHTDSLKLHIDSIKEWESPPEEERKLSELKINTLQWMGRFYQLIVPILFLASLAIYFWIIILEIRARSLSPRTIILSAILISLLSRSALLSLIDISSFPAIDKLYLAPAHPLLLLFIAIALITRRAHT